MSQSSRLHRSEVSFFPPSLDDLIDIENPVRALDFYIEGLDLDALGFKLRGKCDLGRPIDYSGKDLLKLLIYGYLNQIRSSRKLEVEATRNLEVIWLLENVRPGFWTINQFRKDNCAAFKSVLRNFHKVCEQLNLFGKELIAIDGSFYKARNNKARNFTAKKLARMEAKIDAAIDAYNQTLDEEDKAGGDPDDAGEIPEPAVEQADPADQQSEAEREQEDLFGECDVRAEARAVTTKPGNLKAEGSLEELEAKKRRIEELKEMAKQSPSGQVSLTDQDSRLLKKGSQSVVGHNIQCGVDSKHHLIADTDIVQSGSDRNQLFPMVQSTCEALDIKPTEEKPLDALVDGGYYNASQMSRCEENGVRVFIPTIKKNTNHEPGYGIDDFTYNEETDEYICPAGSALTRHKDSKNREVTYQIYYSTAACRGCQFLKKCTKGKYRKLWISEFKEVEEKIAARMEAEPAKYAQRMALAEHPFGTMKSIWGYAQFMVTGHPGCKGELSLMSFAHNWKRAFKIAGMEKLMKAIAIFAGIWVQRLAAGTLYFFPKRFAGTIGLKSENDGQMTKQSEKFFELRQALFPAEAFHTVS